MRNVNSKPSHMRAMIVGCIICSAGPVAIGVWRIWHEIDYRASLPQVPNSASCGMSMLGALAILFVVSPACGVVGAAAGFAVSKLRDQFGWHT